MPSMRRNIFKQFEDEMLRIEKVLPDLAINELARAVQAAQGNLDQPYMRRWSSSWGEQPQTIRQANEQLFGAINPSLRFLASQAPDADVYEDFYQNLAMGALGALKSWDPNRGDFGRYAVSRAFYGASEGARAERGQPLSSASVPDHLMDTATPALGGTVYEKPPWYQNALSLIPSRGITVSARGRSHTITPDIFRSLIPHYEAGVSRLEPAGQYPLEVGGQLHHVSGAALRPLLRAVKVAALDLSGLTHLDPMPTNLQQAMGLRPERYPRPFVKGEQVSPLGGPEVGIQTQWDYFKGHQSYTGATSAQMLHEQNVMGQRGPQSEAQRTHEAYAANLLALGYGGRVITDAAKEENRGAYADIHGQPMLDPHRALMPPQDTTTRLGPSDTPLVTPSPGAAIDQAMTTIYHWQPVGQQMIGKGLSFWSDDPTYWAQAAGPNATLFSQQVPLGRWVQANQEAAQLRARTGGDPRAVPFEGVLPQDYPFNAQQLGKSTMNTRDQVWRAKRMRQLMDEGATPTIASKIAERELLETTMSTRERMETKPRREQLAARIAGAGSVDATTAAAEAGPDAVLEHPGKINLRDLVRGGGKTWYTDEEWNALPIEEKQAIYNERAELHGHPPAAGTTGGGAGDDPPTPTTTATGPPPPRDPGTPIPQRDATPTPAPVRQTNQQILQRLWTNLAGPGWEGMVSNFREGLRPERVTTHGITGRATTAGGFDRPLTGQDILSPEHTAEAVGIANQAVSKAAGMQRTGSAPSDFATFRKRIDKFIDKTIEERIAGIEASGTDAGDKVADRQLATRIKGLARRMVGQAARDIAGPNALTSATEIGYGAESVSIDELQTRAEQMPWLKQQMQQLGPRGMQEVSQYGGTFTQGDPGGPSFTVPPAGRGGRPWRGPSEQGGRRGPWGGAMGSALYSMYIARRFWGYTGDPVMQAMGQYGQTAADLGPLWSGDTSQEGAAGMPSTAYRRQYMLGQGAYQQFGGLTGPLQDFLGTRAGGRLSASTGVAAGLLIGGHILGSGLPMMGMAAPSAASGVIGRAAAGAAGAAGPLSAAMMGLTVGTEIANVAMGTQYGMLDVFGVANQAIGRVAFLTSGPEMQKQILEGPLGEYLQRDFAAEAADAGVLAGYDEFQDAVKFESSEEAAATFAAARSLTGQPGNTMATQMWGKEILDMSREEGISQSAAASILGSAATQEGYALGDLGGLQAAKNVRGMSPAERQTYNEAGGRKRSIISTFKQIAPTLGKKFYSQFADRFKNVGQAMEGYGYASQMQSWGVGEWQSLFSGQQMAFRTNPALGRAQMAAMETVGAAAGPEAYGLFRSIAMQANMGQLNLFQAMSQGDPGAWSYAYRQDQGGLPFLTQGGRPIYTESWEQFTELMQGLEGRGMYTAGISEYGERGRQITGRSLAEGIGLSVDAVGSLTGPGGSFDTLQRERRETLHGYRMAGIGMAIQGITAQQQHLWGGGQYTGTPAAGSMWAMQNQQRQMQYASTMAGFGFQMERMGVQNVFSQQQEGLAYQRMGVQQDWQSFSMGFQRQGQLTQRGWTREDWQYQDTMRGMQFGWGLEDMDEAIRMTSGRQRRQLVRQRDRMVLTENMESGQVERNRERQEELWARQDEHFVKQQEYVEALVALDEEQFAMNVSQREELYEMDRENMQVIIADYRAQFDLQTEIIEKQRQFQADNLERQKAALGLQAKAAELQHEMDEDNRAMGKFWDDTMGKWRDRADYEKIKMAAGAVESLIKALGNIDPWIIQALTLIIGDD